MASNRNQSTYGKPYCKWEEMLAVRLRKESALEEVGRQHKRQKAARRHRRFGFVPAQPLCEQGDSDSADTGRVDSS